MKRSTKKKPERGLRSKLSALGLIAAMCFGIVPGVFAQNPIPCPTNLDVMLVIDNSASTSSEGLFPPQPLGSEKDFAKNIVDLLDLSKDRVGVVWYAQDANLQASLTSSEAQINAAIDAGTVMGTNNTNQGAAIAAGQAALAFSGRADARKIIVLITNGEANWPEQATTGITSEAFAENNAQAAKNAGFLIYTVGFGGNTSANPTLLGTLASNSGTSFFMNSSGGLNIDLADRVVSAFCPVPSPVPPVPNPPAPQVLGVEAVPVLSITKTADSTTILPAGMVTYTITLRNTGTAPAVNVRINDMFPFGFATSLMDPTPSWVVPTIAAGATWTTRFSVVAGPAVTAGSHVNRVTAVADNHAQVEATSIITMPQVLGVTTLPDTGMPDKGKGLFGASLLVFLASSVAGTSLLLRRKTAKVKA